MYKMYLQSTDYFYLKIYQHFTFFFYFVRFYTLLIKHHMHICLYNTRRNSRKGLNTSSLFFFWQILAQIKNVVPIRIFPLDKIQRHITLRLSPLPWQKHRLLTEEKGVVGRAG